VADPLDGMIGAMRDLAGFDERVAALAAPKLEAAARARASEGVDPQGRAWAPRKSDGGRALANAAAAIRAESAGATAALVVTGPEYWHQTAKDGGALPQRKMIPAPGDELPPELRAACDEASAAAFEEATGAR